MDTRFRTSLAIAIFGTLISIIAGVYSAYQLQDNYKAIIFTLLIEIVLLIVALGFLIVELRGQFQNWLDSMITLIKASNYIGLTRDEVFAGRFANISKELRELSEGRYSLANIREVYDDDIRSIGQLKSGDSLASMCPVQGTPEDASAQLKNKNFVASMNAHLKAAADGVTINRIYIFENSSTYNDASVQKHLKEAAVVQNNNGVKSGIKISIILLDDDSFSDAKELPRDFIIFGNKKVSVGRISAESRVAGGDVFADRETIDEYKIMYEGLLRNSEAFK